VRLFLDTSALIKRYVTEPGSERVLELSAEADALAVSVVALPEAISTLRRLVRETRLTEAHYRALKAAITQDLADADVCDLTPSALRYAVRCLERNPLRALDAVHVGCARVYRPDRFLSADRRQSAAARNEGLPVELVGG